MTSAVAVLRCVEALGASFGFERSAKLVDGALYDDRCLMSLHRSAFGADPVSALCELVSVLGAPEFVRDALPEAMRGAQVFHIGHESEGGEAMRKLYFEYLGDARAAMAAGRPVLVHLAHKWVVGAARSTAITRYVWRPCATLADAEARIVERLPAPRLRVIALDLLERAASLADKGGFNMLDVEEAGNPRHSLDINLYDARLALSDVEPLLMRAGVAFSVPSTRIISVFQPAQAPLGHLAAGVDRKGREFVTFYFGVEARGK